MNIRQGEIYLVKLDPTVGSEQGKTRPGLVIQNDVGNEFSPVTIVAPITSQLGKKEYPTEVWTTPEESGLQFKSRVLLNQIRTVDKSRLEKKLGELSTKKMLEVNKAIQISLGLL